jgi:surfeit locus 1 family protein
MRRLPLVPTLIVLIAAALMVRLGLWQLDRARWKEALLARYTAAQGQRPIAYPLVPRGQDLLFRRAEAFCLQPVSWRVEPGRSRAGQSGWRHIAACRTGAEGPGVSVDAGWSSDYTVKPVWPGGKVAGVVAPLPEHRSVLAMLVRHGPPEGVMLVAADPAPGLQPSAPPSLEDVPNNHRAYAVQWFIFAGLALLIYALALWRRLKGDKAPKA